MAYYRPKRPGRHVHLGTALNFQGIKRRLLDHDQAMGRCAMPAEAKPGQRLILTLTVNAQGEVTEVKPSDGGPKAEPWVKCLLEAIKAWRWQRAGGGQEARIRLELEVRA